VPLALKVIRVNKQFSEMKACFVSDFAFSSNEESNHALSFIEKRNEAEGGNYGSQSQLSPARRPWSSHFDFLLLRNCTFNVDNTFSPFSTKTIHQLISLQSSSQIYKVSQLLYYLGRALSPTMN
jgi:hypothetical protein